MHIIIDGYNLIGSAQGLRGELQQQRDRLIEQLVRYQETKGYQITVVFDGWRSGWVHEVQEMHGGLGVIFSRQGEKADSVIARLAREMGNSCLVVTSDREVRRAAEASGAVAIYAGEFSAKLRNLDREIAPNEDEGLKGKGEIREGFRRRRERGERG